MESKLKGNDQELIQSNPTSHPQNQNGESTHTNLLTCTKDAHSKTNEQPFPKQVVIQLPKLKRLTELGGLLYCIESSIGGALGDSSVRL